MLQTSRQPRQAPSALGAGLRNEIIREFRQWTFRGVYCGRGYDCITHVFAFAGAPGFAGLRCVWLGISYYWDVK